jgi:hypothetical protein
MDEQRPSEQRGGPVPGDDEAREKGSWAASAQEGVVPAELGGSDAPAEKLAEDPELGSGALGRTTGSDEPATEAGIDATAGDRADAVTDGGSEPPEGVEPDLKDATAGARAVDADSAG